MPEPKPDDFPVGSKKATARPARALKRDFVPKVRGVREHLLRAGVEQTEQESLAGACARYLGVNGRQLQKPLIESCSER